MAVMLGLVEEGCIPVMRRAKEALGGVCCIAGNVPTAPMAVGTPDEVKAYCKELIKVAGVGGGFILTNGCGMTMQGGERQGDDRSR